MKKLTLILLSLTVILTLSAVSCSDVKKRLTRSDDMKDILHLSAELSSKNYQNFIMAAKKNGDSLDYKSLDSIRQASDLVIKKQLDSVVNEAYN